MTQQEIDWFQCRNQ